MKFSAIRAAALAAAAADMVSAQTPTEPCAAVSSAWAAQIAATATPTVEATVAHDCLNSVPIDKQGALRYFESMKPYVEWQSDTVFKKNPPADYFYPPHDIWGVIEEVKAAVEADKYDSEYAWQQDLYIKLFGPAHDGHFVSYPDVLTNAIEWQRPLALVSISDKPDGAAPEIKVYSDVISSPDTASVVAEINGKDAETFLSEWVFAVSGNQDADAAYNSLFYEKAFAAEISSNGYFQNGGRTRYVYPGSTTSLKFANGTSLELNNIARIKGDWSGVVDGPSYFAKFAPGATSTGSTAKTTPSPAPSPAARAAVPGYPEPVISSSDGVISGYYLTGAGFEDTAVLVALSFAPADQVEFQQVAQDFFAAAKKAGKKNLVVDVSVNGGGYIFSGYDLFRQLFPDIVQEGLGRWRENPGFNAISEVFSANSADFDADTAPEDIIYQYESVYNYRYDIDEANKHFKSFEDKFGPQEFLGDSFTDVMQWDFDDPLNTINATFGFGTDITGYRSRANFTRPFAGPENIVVVLDGYCASTCTLFSQFLVHDAGVKTIAMGGRPSREGLIQGVGGVKGSQSYGYADVYANVQSALAYTNDSALVAALSAYDTYAIGRNQVSNLNVKDEILRANLADGTPAQFVAEYSDCRLWWTEAMVRDVSAVWRAAASAAFGDGKCAYGAIDNNAPGADPPAYPTTSKKSKSKRTIATAVGPFGRPRFPIPASLHLPTVAGKKRVSGGAQMHPMAFANQFMKVVD
ncbi:putative peptidase s41 family protein [Rosellinia necatrix]|uniref:Putative peptidase s41 family protein n=1 Tax=Rosellinia necatrix TaxID=77044 RepID=A0A1W2TPA5_ROSNE|nr:putative peptidase s41 family protein [Rosellinia necatrix]